MMHQIEITLTVEGVGKPWHMSQVHMEVHFSAEKDTDFHGTSYWSIQVEWSKLTSIDWWQGDECVTLTNEELKAMGAYGSVHAKYHAWAVEACESGEWHDECIEKARN